MVRGEGIVDVDGYYNLRLPIGFGLGDERVNPDGALIRDSYRRIFCGHWGGAREFFVVGDDCIFRH